jgi:nitroreductase
MEFFDVIAARHSVRTFRPDPVPDELVTRCLEAARVAPSWRNGQCWHFVVIRDAGIIGQLAAQRTFGYPINSWLRSAPCVIIACADPSQSGTHAAPHGDLPYWAVDTAIATQQLVLAATALGLGTCWIGGFQEDGVRRMIGAPDRIRIVALTPLGYPAEREGMMGRVVKSIAQSRKRKPLDQIAHYDRW